jgi:cysteine desulfurase family protein
MSSERGRDPIIYLDNGATSFPKPPPVIEAVSRWFTEYGGSPGRSGHRMAIAAARLHFEARESMSTLLGAPSSRRIVFTLNATEALNLAITGVITRGDHVVTSSMEHNSVMRPLRHLAHQGVINLTVVPCSSAGDLDPQDLVSALTPATRLVVMTHASNVTGTLMPVPFVANACRERGILFLVDAAQTAGALPLDVISLGVDLLAFTGHKSLFGPMGTGGLWVREGVEVQPLVRGGTGSNSEDEEHPSFFPDRLEAGTPNAVGLAGLKAGVEYVLSAGVQRIRETEEAHTARLLEGLREIPGLRLHGGGSALGMVPVVSFTLDGLAPSEVGFLLDEGYGILCRVGLHCSPAAHRTLGTFPSGTVRFSPGWFTTSLEIDRALEAVRDIARRRRG